AHPPSPQRLLHHPSLSFPAIRLRRRPQQRLTLFPSATLFRSPRFSPITQTTPYRKPRPIRARSQAPPPQTILNNPSHSLPAMRVTRRPKERLTITSPETR